MSWTHTVKLRQQMFAIVDRLTAEKTVNLLRIKLNCKYAMQSTPEAKIFYIMKQRRHSLKAQVCVAKGMVKKVRKW